MSAWREFRIRLAAGVARDQLLFGFGRQSKHVHKIAGMAHAARDGGQHALDPCARRFAKTARISTEGEQPLRGRFMAAFVVADFAERAFR